jgi:tRNA-dihydrouridine synthase B
MIGRGAIGNPWIFSRLTHWLKTRELLPPPTMKDKRDVALGHLRELENVLGERHAVLHGRKHLAAYTKGMPGSAAFREAVNRLESLGDVMVSVAAYFDRAILSGSEELAFKGDAHAA